MEDLGINGGPNSDPASWIKHLLMESKRLGEHVREEQQRTQTQFIDLREDFHDCQDSMRADMNNIKLELLSKIADLEQKHAVSIMEMRLKVAGLAILSSSITSVLWWLVQGGWAG